MRQEPVRTCVACRTRRPQTTMVRVARAPDGTVTVDAGSVRGKGRGAYLCHSVECVNQAKRRQALRRTLKAAVPETIYDELHEKLTRECPGDHTDGE